MREFIKKRKMVQKTYTWFLKPNKCYFCTEFITICNECRIPICPIIQDEFMDLELCSNTYGPEVDEWIETYYKKTCHEICFQFIDVCKVCGHQSY